MIVEQLYTGCLAQGAYYIESEGEAAVIDPLRETAPYVRKAEKAGARIKYVFETHFHADFVSGHIDLARKTGATIVYGPNANTGYEAHIAQDDEEFTIGRVRIRALHTPGHTLESTTYLLLDETGREHAIFTGDTLFIGDVGRPDLAIKGNLTEHDLAGMLYDSLHAKIVPLPDDVIVYPAHGAGSACGKNMSKETTDRLGNQKRFNYALQAKTREQFVEQVLHGLTEAPQYFAQNARLNKEGYESIDRVMKRGSQPLSPNAFEIAVNETSALLQHWPERVVCALGGRTHPRLETAYCTGYARGSGNRNGVATSPRGLRQLHWLSGRRFCGLAVVRERSRHRSVHFGGGVCASACSATERSCNRRAERS
jgi:hydroxyacylglutathione hydrolase